MVHGNRVVIDGNSLTSHSLNCLRTNNNVCKMNMAISAVVHYINLKS